MNTDLIDSISEEQIKKYLKNGESAFIDFKASMKFGKKNDAKQHYGLIKDILSMSNIKGGGILLIGVSDDKTVEGIKEDCINSFDTSKVSEAVKWHHVSNAKQDLNFYKCWCYNRIAYKKTFLKNNITII